MGKPSPPTAVAWKAETLYLPRRLCRIPTRRVARRFGRDDSTFSRPLASLEDQLTTDAQLRHRIESLVRSLRQTATASAASPPFQNQQLN